MPPTPPPVVTSTDHHPLLLPELNHARQYYQSLPDSHSATTTTTPPPQPQPQPQKQQQQQQPSLEPRPPPLPLPLPLPLPAACAKEDGSARFEFPLPPRAPQQTHNTTRRQTDGCTTTPGSNVNQQHHHNHNHNHHEANSRRPIDPFPAATVSAAAAAAPTVTAATVTVTATSTSTATATVDPPPLNPNHTGNTEDEDYDLSILKRVGNYRRSGTSGARGPAHGLVHRGIGLVRRDLVGGYSPIAVASATPGSGSLKKVELAGRYAQPRSPPPSIQNPPSSATLHPPASPLHSHSQSDLSVSEEEEEDHSEEDEEEEEEEEDMEEEESWISSYCSMVGHEYFAEVSEEFIEDDFNLTGLGAMVPMYKEALEMILDVEPEDDSDSAASASESLSEQPGAQASTYRRRAGHMRVASDVSMIENSAELLYGLIHQRFITSRQGIQVMYEKYLSNHFGFCPRVYCNNSRVLPCGYSDTPGIETVKLFCPSCCDIYVPPNSRFQTVDGAYFGTTFASLFLMTFPELDVSGNGRKEMQTGTNLNSAGGRKGANNANAPLINGVLASNLAPGLGKGKQYEMRIYGFRVSERARSGPRMGWLRSKPEHLMALDETVRYGAPEAEVGYSSDEEEGLEDSEQEESEGEDEMNAVGGGVAPVRRKRGTSPMDTNGAR